MIEKDVESAFEKFIDGRNHTKVYGRQVSLPMGILDLLLVIEHDHEMAPVVVEFKLGTIDDKAVCQCLGYMAQVELLVNFNCAVFNEVYKQAESIGWLVGSGISKMAWRVVKAAGMSYWRYYLDSSGEIQFEEPDWKDMEIMGSVPSEAILSVARRLNLVNTKHRQTWAEWGGLDENFEAAVIGRNVRPPEKLKDTIAYWKRNK